MYTAAPRLGRGERSAGQYWAVVALVVFFLALAGFVAVGGFGDRSPAGLAARAEAARASSSSGGGGADKGERYCPSCPVCPSQPVCPAAPTCAPPAQALL